MGPAGPEGYEGFCTVRVVLPEPGVILVSSLVGRGTWILESSAVGESIPVHRVGNLLPIPHSTTSMWSTRAPHRETTAPLLPVVPVTPLGPVPGSVVGDDGTGVRAGGGVPPVLNPGASVRTPWDNGDASIDIKGAHVGDNLSRKETSAPARATRSSTGSRLAWLLDPGQLAMPRAREPLTPGDSTMPLSAAFLDTGAPLSATSVTTTEAKVVPEADIARIVGGPTEVHLASAVTRTQNHVVVMSSSSRWMAELDSPVVQRGGRRRRRRRERRCQRWCRSPSPSHHTLLILNQALRARLRG